MRSMCHQERPAIVPAPGPRNGRLGRTSGGQADRASRTGQVLGLHREGVAEHETISGRVLGADRQGPGAAETYFVRHRPRY